MRLLPILVLVLLTATATFGQGTGQRRVPEFTLRQEYVSLDSTLPFDRAVAALGELSKKFSGKILIDPEERTSPIGVSIRGLHWRDALDLIAEVNGLRVMDKADYIELRTARLRAEGDEKKSVVTAETREVLISTVFFALNLNKTASFGIDWSLSFLKGKDTADAAVSAPVEIAPGLNPSAEIHYGRPYKYGNILATLQMYSQNGLGEVISSPRIIVRSAERGRVQVGQDISVPRRDISAGGTISISMERVSTGTIVEVKPEVIREGDVEYVSLDLSIERSAAVTLGDAPIFDKNSTRTYLLMLDGEEVFISGLYFNSEKVVRSGVPILKDLPWWFFGLRYVFGSDMQETIRQELAILLKVDILPTLKERMARKVKENALEQMRKRFDQDVERFKTKKERD
jgi:type IV pilus assembly protein PilQ